MKPKISFYTLGCRLNQSETAVLERSFKKDEYQVVDFNQPADVVVINTCTVTENGDADTRRLVNKVNRINPDARIALIGCQAQVQKEKLTELPNVHWVVGNGVKMNLPDLLNRAADRPQVIAPAIEKGEFTVPMAGIDARRTRANIKIQDGCDFFCSFCEIPFARGRARSRAFNDITAETRALVAAGHKEIVITGINVGTYANRERNILDVLDDLEKIDGLKRIRISSIEPTTIPEEILERMKGGTKLCRYLHVPLQSADDGVLRDMGRKYSWQEFLQFISLAKAKVPEICIGTDVIVGFPSESDRQFDETHKKLKNTPIDYFHVFSYSKRNYARSKHYKTEVPVPTIQARSRKLRQLSSRKRRLFHQRLVGTEQTVLFEQIKDGFAVGLTDNYVRVKVKGSQKLKNSIRRVRIKSIGPNGVLGTLKKRREI